MPRPFRPILACLLLASCATAPAGSDAVPGSRSGAPLQPLILTNGAELTHEGGIVYGQSLDAIRDAASRGAASILQVELSLALRADRTMRDAGLLASAPAGYVVLAAGTESAPPGQAARGGTTEKPEPSPRPGPSAKSSPPRKGQAPDATAAKAAWEAATPEQRAAANASREAQAAAVRTAVAPLLAADGAAFTRRGPDAEAPSADGGKAVTTTFDVTGQDGPRAVEVQRTFDAAGDLVEQVVRLQGGTATEQITATRSWRYLPDGSAEGDASITLALPGGNHVIAWQPLAEAGGTLVGEGRITRPDGSSLPAGVVGAQGQVTRLYAMDAAAGIKAEVQAELGAASGTLTIDAGPAGLVKLVVPVDAQASR